MSESDDARSRVFSPENPLSYAMMEEREGFETSIRQGDLESVRSYLEICRNINGPLEYTYPFSPALHVAIKHGQYEITGLLIDRGATLTPSAETITPLGVAADYGQWDIFDLLIARGANPQDYCKHVYTMARHEFISKVKLFFERGRHLIDVDVDGHNLLWVIASSQPSSARGLEIFSSPRSEVDRGAVAKLILDQRPEIDINKRFEGFTALVKACSRGHSDVVETLLERGAFVHISGHDLSTPLHGAASSGRPKVCELLLDRGVSVSAVNSAGETALHLATKRGSCGTISVLWSHYANINATDNKGRTPLHVASEQNNGSAMRTLLMYGADIDALCSAGLTPLGYAFKAWDEWLIPVRRGDPPRRIWRAGLDSLECSALLEAEMIKRQLLGLPVSGKNWEMFDWCGEKEEYKSECTAELNLLSETVSRDTGLTFDDILRTKEGNLFSYSDALISSLESCLSGGKLKLLKTIVTVKLHDLRRSAAVKTRCDVLPSLPLACVENIVKYLPRSQITKLVNSNDDLE